MLSVGRVSIGYYMEGFLAIQRAVDRSITEAVRMMSSAPPQNISVELKKFPYPPYYNDNFVLVIQMQLPFIIMLSFIVTAPVICKDVVLEKEKKLKVHLWLYSVNLRLDQRRGGGSRGSELHAVRAPWL